MSEHSPTAGSTAVMSPPARSGGRLSLSVSHSRRESEAIVEANVKVTWADVVLAIEILLYDISMRLHQSRSSYQSKKTGVDSDYVDLFPKWRFQAGASAESSGDCIVCLLEYEDGDEMRRLLPCNHRFHKACIDPWLADHETCPVCRQIVAPSRLSRLVYALRKGLEDLVTSGDLFLFVAMLSGLAAFTMLVSLPFVV